VGSPLEGEICQRRRRGKTNSYANHPKWLKHLEYGLEKHIPNPTKLFLGNKEWEGGPLLGGCLKQMSKWLYQVQLTRIKEAMLSQGKTRVTHYWAQGENQHKWCNWIPKEGWNGFQDQEMLLRFLEDLENRKILVSAEEDRLGGVGRPRDPS
jgi:hypothetical protein